MPGLHELPPALFSCGAQGRQGAEDVLSMPGCEGYRIGHKFCGQLADGIRVASELLQVLTVLNKVGQHTRSLLTGLKGSNDEQSQKYGQDNVQELSGCVE